MRFYHSWKKEDLYGKSCWRARPYSVNSHVLIDGVCTDILWWNLILTNPGVWQVVIQDNCSSEIKLSDKKVIIILFITNQKCSQVLFVIRFPVQLCEISWATTWNIKAQLVKPWTFLKECSTYNFLVSNKNLPKGGNALRNFKIKIFRVYYPSQTALHTSCITMWLLWPWPLLSKFSANWPLAF